MRQLIKEWVSIAATSLPIVGPIYEFGSLQVLGQEGFADLRTLFPNKQYVGCDMREGPGVDKIIDLHDIDLPDESVGTALSLDTLEHVEYPYKAMDEIYRIILPDGIAVISSVMQFPIHDYPYDYLRFTPEAFKSLLKPFRHSFVGFAGDKDFPHTVRNRVQRRQLVIAGTPYQIREVAEASGTVSRTRCKVVNSAVVIAFRFPSR